MVAARVTMTDDECWAGHGASPKQARSKSDFVRYDTRATEFFTPASETAAYIAGKVRCNLQDTDSAVMAVYG